MDMLPFASMRARDLRQYLLRAGVAQGEVQRLIDKKDLIALAQQIVDSQQWWKHAYQVAYTAGIGLLALLMFWYREAIYNILTAIGGWLADRLYPLQKRSRHIYSAYKASCTPALCLYLICFAADVYSLYLSFSSALTWILPNTSPIRDYLAPALYIPLSFPSPGNRFDSSFSLNVGPMVTLSMLRFVIFRIHRFAKRLIHHSRNQFHHSYHEETNHNTSTNTASNRVNKSDHSSAGSVEAVSSEHTCAHCRSEGVTIRCAKCKNRGIVYGNIGRYCSDICQTNNRDTHKHLHQLIKAARIDYSSRGAPHTMVLALLEAAILDKLPALAEGNVLTMLIVGTCDWVEGDFAYDALYEYLRKLQLYPTLERVDITLVGPETSTKHTQQFVSGHYSITCREGKLQEVFPQLTETSFCLAVVMQPGLSDFISSWAPAFAILIRSSILTITTGYSHLSQWTMDALFDEVVLREQFGANIVLPTTRNAAINTLLYQQGSGAGPCAFYLLFQGAADSADVSLLTYEQAIHRNRRRIYDT